MAADDPILFALSDFGARFVPFERHVRSFFNLTFKLGVTADIYLQRCDFLPKDRGRCCRHRQKKQVSNEIYCDSLGKNKQTKD